MALHEFSSPAGFVGWLGDRLYFSDRETDAILVADGPTPEMVCTVEGVATDVKLGLDGDIVVAATTGVWWCEAPGTDPVLLSRRVASVGIHLVDEEVCIVSRDPCVEFFQPQTLANGR